MPLQPLVIRAPGIMGLNLEGEDVVADATYAKVAKNLVFDKAGRIASRKGYVKINDTTNDATLCTAIFMYDSESGNTVISALDDHIYETTTDKQGALAHTTSNWQFQNFTNGTEGIIVGAQGSESLISYNGTGDFAAITPNGGGTVPNGNCLHSAFGRLWTTDSSATVIYGSALLDETTWPTSTTTTGSIDINALGNEMAVRDGYDRIVAINHIQDKLVVFMENSIVIYSNPFDASNIAIAKTLTNVGCIARDSVQHVGNDLVFLSRDGIRSLVRAVEEDNFPLRDLSRAVRADLLSDVSTSVGQVKSAYYPEEGLYIMLTTADRAWVFDFKRVFEDGIPRITTWDVPNWHSLYYHEGTLYIGQVGEYGKYDGYTEDGATYQIEYKSLNVDFGSPNIKALKKTTARLEGGDNQSIAFTYEWDYGETDSTAIASIPDESAAGVYNTDNYGTAIYGDGLNRAQVVVNPFGNGEVLAFGLRADVNGTRLSVEQMSHFAKLGRLAR